MKQVIIKREDLEKKALETLENKFDRWDPKEEFEFIHRIECFEIIIPFSIEDGIFYWVPEDIEHEELEIEIINEGDFNIQEELEKFLDKELSKLANDEEEAKGIEETNQHLNLNYR